MGAEPEPTALRTALWRALHVAADEPPHVLADEVGLRLSGAGEEWRRRTDMDPGDTSRYRAAVVARARFTEDLVADYVVQGVRQYVVLGAGLDTYAQRRPESASALRVYEVDRPEPQAWKRKRLTELGFGVPDRLRFVADDFERDGGWWERLAAAGFDTTRRAVVSSAGVSMYLTKTANAATLARVAALAPGSAFVMSFLLPADLLDPGERAAREVLRKLARSSGAPLLSFYPPGELLRLAREAGFRDVQHVSSWQLGDRYFTDRADGLRPAAGEELLLATT